MHGEGADALAYLDRILAQRPTPDKTLFSKCTEQLAGLRNRMIAERADRTRLEHVNAVISIVMAGHFPLGPIPWDDIVSAREWLADIAGHAVAPE